MTTLPEKLAYLADIALKRAIGSAMACPNCGSKQSERLDHKFYIAELRRCHECRLLFRTPGDDLSQTSAFYQFAYSEGFTTAMPSDDALQMLLQTHFAGTEKDFTPRIDVLKALGLKPGARVFDFGCSWGYGSWQITQAGFDVTAFEISQPRAEFARRKLGVDVLSAMPKDKTSAGALGGAFDCFFSSHVIEHVPQPGTVFDFARTLLKPDGLFVAFTPNGSLQMRAANPRSWHSIWGKVHPCMIDNEFYWKALGRNILLDSTPIDHARLATFAQSKALGEDQLAGDELLCVARL